MQVDKVIAGIFLIISGTVAVIFRKQLSIKTSEFWSHVPILGMKELYRDIGPGLNLLAGCFSILFGILMLFGIL